jgi:hypothetical protein
MAAQEQQAAPGVRYADSRTLAGALRIGHGRGAYAAVDEASAHGGEALAPLVYARVARDDRFDPDLDERGVYLARLVRDLNVPLGPIIAQLNGATRDPGGIVDPGHAFDTALLVLAVLAGGGDADALAALREYVRAGVYWLPVLQELAARCPASAWDDLAGVASTRLDDGASLGEQPLRWRAAPWRPWAAGTVRDPRIVAAVARARARERHLAPARQYARTRPQVLLDMLADARITGFEKDLVLRELGNRPPRPALLALIPELVATAPGRPMPGLMGAALRAATGDPVRALWHARAWVAGDDQRLVRVGARILANHSDGRRPGDVTALLGVLEWMRADGDPCVEALVDGAARWGTAAAPLLPEITRAWSGSPHSFVRVSCLRAFQRIDPGGTRQALVDGLRDCQAGVRALAVRYVPLDERVAGTLRYLSEDPLEDRDIRADARSRLA